MSALDDHVREIDALNQRGGRMLSIVDLIEAGTIDRDLGAHLAAAIGAGASFMVGALPGAAGKTTVMGALLNLTPADADLRTADGKEAILDGISNPRPRRVYVCHEIGKGRLHAYLWGPILKSYFALAQKGHILATNLHADTLEEARDQICGAGSVPEEAFRRMNLALFLRFDPSTGRREIVEAWESDGGSPHRRIFANGRLEPDGSRLVPPGKTASARTLIHDLLASGARTLSQVRAFITAADG